MKTYIGGGIDAEINAVGVWLSDGGTHALFLRPDVIDSLSSLMKTKQAEAIDAVCPKTDFEIKLV